MCDWLKGCAMKRGIRHLTFAFVAIATALPAFAQIVCTMGQMACGQTCYNPGMGYTCTNGIVCGPGQQACGNTCYTPAFGETCNMETRGRDGRDRGDRAWDDRDRDRDRFGREGNTAIICGQGQVACGNSCFDPTSGATCTNGVVCQSGFRACGNGCYNPAMGATCTNGVACGPGLVACGISCYSPGSGATCTNGIICPGGFQACGNSCFNPAMGQTCNVPAHTQRSGQGASGPAKDQRREAAPAKR
jgi:hypothetical protein